jgi:hypothetical protein
MLPFPVMSLPFRGQGTWNWSVTWLYHGLTLAPWACKQDLELEKARCAREELANGRSYPRPPPLSTKVFAAVTPHLTSPGRAPPLSRLDNAERVVFGGGEGASRFPVFNRSHHRQLFLGTWFAFSPPTIPGHQIGDGLSRFDPLPPDPSAIPPDRQKWRARQWGMFAVP